MGPESSSLFPTGLQPLPLPGLQPPVPGAALVHRAPLHEHHLGEERAGRRVPDPGHLRLPRRLQRLPDPRRELAGGLLHSGTNPASPHLETQTPGHFPGGSAKPARCESPIFGGVPRTCSFCDTRTLVFQSPQFPAGGAVRTRPALGIFLVYGSHLVVLRYYSWGAGVITQW